MSGSHYAESLVGWADGSIRSARAIVPLVIDIVRPQSVVDVGCGMGAWLSVFEESGVSDFLGFDGDYVRRDELMIPAERFVACDLEAGVTVTRRFDLAVCLEVAEHLSREAAPTLVRSLVDLAPVALFSAAIPRQRGLNHVNEQWPTYWAELFAFHDYACVDAFRLRIWDDPGIEWWYRQNILLFVAPDVDLGLPTTTRPLSLVHPERFLSTVDLRPLSLLKRAPTLVKQLVRERRG